MVPFGPGARTLLSAATSGVAPGADVADCAEASRRGGTAGQECPRSAPAAGSSRNATCPAKPPGPVRAKCSEIHRAAGPVDPLAALRRRAATRACGRRRRSQARRSRTRRRTASRRASPPPEAAAVRRRPRGRRLRGESTGYRGSWFVGRDDFFHVTYAAAANPRTIGTNGAPALSTRPTARIDAPMKYFHLPMTRDSTSIASRRTS